MSSASGPGVRSGLRVRPYALTGGRTRAQTEMPLEAMVRSTTRGDAAVAVEIAERRRIIVMCATPMALAEVASRLGLPVGVTRVLVGDLVTEGLLVAHHRPVTSDRPDLRLLERVLHGLQAL